VLIAHSPPAGFHDTVKGAHKGSIALNKHIERVLPKLVVYGHIHKPGVEQEAGVTLCNAAYVGFDRQPNGHPIQVFEL
jgi:Icc-related predicted phosphoesterase